MTGRVRRLGMLLLLGRGGVCGLGGFWPVIGWTWINFGGILSPGRILGSLTGVGMALGFWEVTGLPLASKPSSLLLGLYVEGSSGSSGRESIRDGGFSCFSVWLEVVGRSGLYVWLLSERGDGGLSGLFIFPIHFLVYLGACALGTGISPIGGPVGVLSPFNMRN